MALSSEYDPRFDAFYMALGALASEWAEYESMINSFIWELCNVEKMAGSCITSQLIGPGPRGRCLVALLNLRSAPGEVINLFNSHASEAEKLGRRRNRFLHDPLLLNKETGVMSRMEVTADRHLVHDFVPTEVEDIDSLKKEIVGLKDRYWELYRRAQAELPPWPKTQFELSRGIQCRHTG